MRRLFDYFARRKRAQAVRIFFYPSPAPYAWKSGKSGDAMRSTGTLNERGQVGLLSCGVCHPALAAQDCLDW